jgi:hypothetical protein
MTFSELRSPEVRMQHLRQNSKRVLPYDFDVVTRRCNQRVSSVGPALASVPPVVGELCFTEAFRAFGDERFPGWRASGRLYGSDLRLVRYTRVHIEVNGWSEQSCEVRVRPVTRRIANWGKRRRHRYYRLAHDAADELVRAIDLAVRRHVATIALEGSIPFCPGTPPTAVLPSGGRI